MMGRHIKDVWRRYMRFVFVLVVRQTGADGHRPTPHLVL